MDEIGMKIEMIFVDWKEVLSLSASGEPIFLSREEGFEWQKCEMQTQLFFAFISPLFIRFSPCLAFPVTVVKFI